jgi:transcriptional regulator with XRE-family HTH domain
MEFNQQLKRRREQLNLTQEELGLRLNVSRSAIAKWEQGKGMPSLELLKTLALFFHCSIDELLGEKGLHLIQNNQRRNFWITASIALLATLATVVSTTLYVIELRKAAQTAFVQEIVRLDSVTRVDNNYRVTYENEAGLKTLSFSQDNVVFRNLEDFDNNLSVNDYVYIERHGADVSRLRVLDNALTPSLKGYRLIINDGINDYEYYYRTYYFDVGEYVALQIASDIVSLADASTNTTFTSYLDHTYSHITINHTIYARNDMGPHARMDRFIDLINIDGTAAESLPTSGIYLQHLSSVNAQFDGYLNDFAYEGETYHLRDVVSYSSTLQLVDTIDSVVVRQFDELDALLKEDTLTSANLGEFDVEQSASYIKYYEDGNIRGRTLETGETQRLFVNNGSPLPTIFNLSID